MFDFINKFDMFTFLIFICLIFLSLPVLAEDIYVFDKVNVIPMDEEKVLKNHSVIIKDNQIEKIESSEKIQIPEKAKIIKGKDKYLIPALSDMHVHLHDKTELKLYLANGVTTIRNMWGSLKHLDIRDNIKDGNILGPVLYTTTPIIDGRPPIWPGSEILEYPQLVESRVDKFINYGYDYLKIYDNISEEIYEKLTEVVPKKGIEIVGHVPDEVGLKKVINSEQYSIEHLDGYISYQSEELNEIIELTVEKGVWNCPTIVVKEGRKKENKEKDIEGLEYINPDKIKNWKESNLSNNKRVDDYIKTLQNIVKKLNEKGGKLLLGTDANNPFVLPGFSIHKELNFLVEAGLSPYQALKTGTYNPALFLDELDKKGTIEKNKDADLVLLEDNPLEDINNTQKIAGVMIRGKWLNKKRLEDELDKVKNNWDPFVR